MLVVGTVNSDEETNSQIPWMPSLQRLYAAHCKNETPDVEICSYFPAYDGIFGQLYIALIAYNTMLCIKVVS